MALKSGLPGLAVHDSISDLGTGLAIVFYSAFDHYSTPLHVHYYTVIIRAIPATI